MKILITGGDGLLAHQIKQIVPRGYDLFSFDRTGFNLTKPELMAQQLANIKPNVVISTAAYNLVDRCEEEHGPSWAVNATGPAILAKMCAEKNIKMVHYGTDYVFDGAKNSPYAETDETNPLNYYGLGKLAGERAVLVASPKHLVLRTSWVFDWHPTQAKTFVHTILKNAREGRPLMATTNQVSVPTFASDLAQWTLSLIQQDANGLFHAVNDEGVSRFDWAKIILEEAVQAKLIPAALPIEPALSSFFSPTMRRPDYTVMDNIKLSRHLGHPLGSWRAGLRKMLAQMK